MNIKDLKHARAVWELGEKVNLYLERVKKHRLPSYPLNEIGTYQLVGPLKERYHDLQASEGYVPPTDPEERKELSIYYQGRFIDAIAAGVSEASFYSGGNVPVVLSAKLHGSPGGLYHGYLVKAKPENAKPIKLKRNKDLEMVVKMLQGGG